MSFYQKFIVQPLVAYAYIKATLMVGQGGYAIYKHIKRRLNDR